ncbi:MAG: class I SAM-dependent DNA methyltransferase [Candidatus Hadarchaeales archaeon]
MGQILEKWLEDRRSVLWRAFGERPFTRPEAIEVLKEDGKTVNVVLSELRKAGWLETRSDPVDSRKKIYTLKPERRFVEDLEKEEITKETLEALLKKAADLIRTRVDYKFILILLFLKRISDKWEMEFESAYREALRDGLSEEEAREEAKSSAYHDYDLPEEFLWENIRRDVNRLPQRLSDCLKALAERNPELKDVVDRSDFIHFATSAENFEILRQLVELFSSKKLHRVSSDILGDAYEWVLRYFAPQKAKEGEVYTPREVIRLLVEILDPKPGESVYDPACGSGGMLIISYDHVRKKHGEGEAGKLFLYGQEANQTTHTLCKMNLYIHGVRDANVALGDTLLYPKFREGNAPKKFNVVIANPPWNQDGFGEEVLKKGEFWKVRYPYGFPPNQSADWAWIQHMLASADEKNGRVGVVIDNGCLFRGGKEGSIRKGVLEDDLLECVILLPEKLFYNTGAPGAILIFNRQKPAGRRGKILFINASSEHEQHPEVRKLNRLGDAHITRIAEAYRDFKDVDGFARVVSLDEVKENDYNLNVTLYVFPEEKVEEIDVEREWEELRRIETEIGEIEGRIQDYLKEVK